MLLFTSPPDVPGSNLNSSHLKGFPKNEISSEVSREVNNGQNVGDISTKRADKDQKRLCGYIMLGQK